MNRERAIIREGIIERYIDELIIWNKKVRLTGYRSREEIKKKLMEINMKAVLLMKINGEGADVGSGNGSLAVAIKAIHPSAKVFCIERNIKKAALISTIMHKIGLDGIEVIVGDINDMKVGYKWEWIVMREVRVNMKLVKNIGRILKERGKIYIITSGDRANEIAGIEILKVEEIEDLGNGYFLVKVLCFM